ncbi:MAG TPA: hypothetical protein VEV65_01620 [Kineosporiaceae bacterium]|nr:hypothetical protein [Kineosporiaceae bacterium]
MVVAEDGVDLALPGREVAAAGAQVAGGGERGVVDVLGVGGAVAVGVRAVPGPGSRDELHRADGAVRPGVAVEPTAVGVVDERHAASAVEAGAVDRRGDVTVGLHVRAAEAAVVGLDAPDAGEQGPADVARGVDAGALLCGGDVRLEHAARDAAAAQGAGVRPRVGGSTTPATVVGRGPGAGEHEDLRVAVLRQDGDTRVGRLLRGDGRSRTDEIVQPRLVPGVRRARHDPGGRLPAAGEHARHGRQGQAEDDDARERRAQTQSADEARPVRPDLHLLVGHTTDPKQPWNG